MQRKPTKNTRGPNTAERAHLAWIKERGICAACNSGGGVIGHHCEGATFRHNRILVGHWFALGLCLRCDDVVTKGSRRAFRETFGPQSALWLKQHEQYHQETGRRASDEIVAAITSWGR